VSFEDEADYAAWGIAGGRSSPSRPIGPGGRYRDDGAVACGEPATVLILTAGVGRGHVAAAEGLRDELASAAPDVRVIVRNGLGERHGALRMLLERAIHWQLAHAPRTYEWTYALVVRSGAGRRVALPALYACAHRTLRATIDADAPDLVVSTYPGVTAALGVMRARGRLAVPVCALITDMASLQFWAHPAVDQHLLTYAESLPEVRGICGRASARVVRAPLAAEHWLPRSASVARAELGLDPSRRLVVISGGGWGVGDLRGAVRAAVSVDGMQVAVVCGENQTLASALRYEHRAAPDVRVMGFVDGMAGLLGAADALVHSTAGMTCLEAAAQGCPTIAYGFSYGHVRHNVMAMARHGLLRHAGDESELAQALRDIVDRGDASRDREGEPPVEAATAILECLDAGRHPRSDARVDPPALVAS